jgi:outer membrane immunogenic protein
LLPDVARRQHRTVVFLLYFESPRGWGNIVMRKRWLTGVGLVALAASPAAAADMPVKAPPALAPAVSWTGFYLGGGIGHGAFTFRNQDLSVGTPTSLEYSSGGKGWLGTVIIGFDYQFSDRLVAGVFADYDWTDLHGEHGFHDAGYAGTLKQRSAWAAGARLGYLVTPHTLFYVTGGYTEARFSGVNVIVFPTGDLFSFQNGATFTGGFVGAGAETHLWSGWFGRVEYRYAAYGAKDIQIFDASGALYGGGLFHTRMEPTVQTVRAAVTYKLGGLVPGLAAAPVAPAPQRTAATLSWTGFYVGAGFGYGAYTFKNHDVLTATGAPSSFEFSAGGTGWLGTVVAGADYQFANRVVAGVFADYDWTRIKGEAFFLNGPRTGTLTQDSSWAVGARIGYLVWPDTLLYVNGGYSEARFSGINLQFSFLPATPCCTQDPATFKGWFAGGGTETQLWSNWFGRLEYRYAAYDSQHVRTSYGHQAILEPTVQTIRLGVNYKFNWAGPLVARY